MKNVVNEKDIFTEFAVTFIDAMNFILLRRIFCQNSVKTTYFIMANDFSGVTLSFVLGVLNILFQILGVLIMDLQ